MNVVRVSNIAATGVVGGVLAVLLAGCGGGSPAPTSDWTAPAWMAEQMQAREQFVPTLQACMDGKGWNLTVDESAGFAEPFYSREEAERALADSHDCMRDQGIDPDQINFGQTEADLRTMYSYDVDTYDCLVAQGVAMEKKPPSVDVYVEEGLIPGGAQKDISESWWPYFDPAILAMSQDEVAQLEQVCPTRWVFATP